MPGCHVADLSSPCLMEAARCTYSRPRCIAAIFSILFTGTSDILPLLNFANLGSLKEIQSPPWTFILLECQFTLTGVILGAFH